MCGLNGDEYTHARLGMNCFKCVSSVRYTTVYTYNQNLAFYYLRAHYRLWISFTIVFYAFYSFGNGNYLI